METNNGCTKFLTLPRGVISSPNYGKTYPGNLACKWTINATIDKRIKLAFDDFVVEKSRNCRSDYLLLYDGIDKNSRLVGRYCSAKPVPFISSSNSIHLEFYSDVSLGYRGFMARYITIEPPTEEPTTWKSRPKFKDVVLNVTCIAGDRVKLRCEVDGTPEPTITWAKNTKRIVQDSETIIRNGSYMSELILKKTKKSDQGTYSCIVSNGFGPSIEASGVVLVEKRKLPLITYTTNNQTISIGDELELFCKANGETPLNMSFLQNHIPLKTRTCAPNGECQLQLTKMFVEDTMITCKSWNYKGQMTRNIIIKVRGPPIIINAPTNQTVRQGDAVNLTCEAAGKNVKISWLKDNETISESFVTREGRSILSVKLSVIHNSTLTCLVEGKDGDASQNIQVSIVKETKGPIRRPIKRKALRFSNIAIPRSRTIPYGSTLEVLCYAIGYPFPNISWILNDTKIDSERSLFANGTSKFKISSLNKTVVVTCVARNVHESIQSTAIFTVEIESVTRVPNKTLESTNENMKVILGAGVGVLVLTVLIVLFIFYRRKYRKKKVEKESQATGAAAGHSQREDQRLIPNPVFTEDKKEPMDETPGVEMLDYPRDSIQYTEILENDSQIEMFLGRAKDLPFSPGEFNVVVRELKDTEPSDEIKDDFDVEASLLANLVHPNVVRLMAVCIKTPPLCLVFEHSSCGYLDEYLQECEQRDLTFPKKPRAQMEFFTELTSVDRLLIAKQIASGMKYLSDKGYVHQELRTRNCLVFKDLQVKVANLGLRWATPDQNFFIMKNEEKRRFPVRWLPPEVVLYGEYSPSADVWSYGVLVWEIFSNAQLPYAGIDDKDVMSYVRGNNILPRPKLSPHEVYEVMKSCWEITPLQRPNFKSLHDTMTALHAGIRV
ncbi:muscle, skeletal receptor tyrosine-protein kinase-like isoform X2 [Xenia sp. Carnegie-2017]|uniref:muscle, skeletal receptor tyrosine-protein kinase-like isoform X2 n=1 Tax=Xenia sp. Carnegie-2017 TaxID=2897299 RepID=UPI001F04376F|nr:muscle, skeletal receptor tyrosine-protein kinase-like isoform X2 [Xenia sp. Carnegie-2017]